MFSCNFLSSRLVQGMVEVRVVISSMYALMGGSRRPGVSCSPPTTHRDARMITSMAMVKANGEMVHPAMMPTPSVAKLWCTLLLTDISARLESRP